MPVIIVPKITSAENPIFYFRFRLILLDEHFLKINASARVALLEKYILFQYEKVQDHDFLICEKKNAS
ncbi:hypothetical protein St703_10360 [Sporolactobacillus terrae]|uniref:Uncharacterized protein n=1 Tax=Sporolactobacillus terrae TaxID=269673 RepID=A0A5K7WUG8_9BACL|nr:hypothetical protein St703_10360 [Sporolactobacillus terrae]